MSRKVISVEDVWKQYRLGSVGMGMLGQDVWRWWHRARGKEDPFVLVGEENDRTKQSDSEFVWALKNISFSVNEGEVLGIIGRNGAGKSTLLKILSRVTAPYKGEVKIKGRVASLLEVGTGFHPDLTGRENIFLNGAILGMKRKEIESKFDEIVSFSGVEKYIDTPVKRYSSGMYVRLAFGVAAHLEPEILIVDEVLAVGDMEFQKKCLGKMKDVSKHGRTVLFVSHNLAAVRGLCTRAIVLEKGSMLIDTTTDEAVARYMNLSAIVNPGGVVFDPPRSKKDFFSVYALSVHKQDCSPDSPISTNDPFVIEIDVEILNDLERIDFTLHFKDESGVIMFVSSTNVLDNYSTGSGRKKIFCHLPADLFNSGSFAVNFAVLRNRREVLLREDDIVTFSIIEVSKVGESYTGRPYGSLRPKLRWSI